MKPPAFQLVRARSVGEALDALADRNTEAKVIAGGQSLMPLLNLRLARPERLIDINAVHELAELEIGPSVWRFGALVRHRTLETNETLKASLPILPRVASEIGHLAIRNRGTLGGTLAHADSAAELPALMVLLEADVNVASAGRGARRVPIGDFFMGPLTTALSEDELLTDVIVPRPVGVEWHGFFEYATRVGDFARVAALLKLRATGDADTSDVVALRCVLFGGDLGGIRCLEHSIEAGTLPPLSVAEVTRSQALLPSLAAHLADQLLHDRIASHETPSRMATHWARVVTARAAADLEANVASRRGEQNRRGG